MDISAIGSVAHVTRTVDAQLNPQQRAERVALVQAVKVVNDAQSFGPTSEVTFSLDRGTNKPIMRIIDRETHEVIAQLPPEYLLRMAAQLGLQNNSKTTPL